MYRYTATKGFQVNVGMSPLGWGTQFFSEVYEVDHSGNVSGSGVASCWYYAPILK